MAVHVPTAQQLVDLLTDIIRRHGDEPAVHQPVLLDLDGVHATVSSVELADITDECRWSGCHRAHGQTNPPADAPRQGVHLAVVIGGLTD